MATNNNNLQYPQFGMNNSMSQFFPQPQGNVYLINNSNEVSMVPVGAVGVSVAICMTEGIMYIKAMQNGNPMLIRYKLNSLDNPLASSVQQQPAQQTSESMQYGNDRVINILKDYEVRIKDLENFVANNTQNKAPQNMKPIDSHNQNENGNLGGTDKWQL